MLLTDHTLQKTAISKSKLKLWKPTVCSIWSQLIWCKIKKKKQSCYICAENAWISCPNTLGKPRKICPSQLSCCRVTPKLGMRSATYTGRRETFSRRKSALRAVLSIKRITRLLWGICLWCTGCLKITLRAKNLMLKKRKRITRWALTWRASRSNSIWVTRRAGTSSAMLISRISLRTMSRPKNLRALSGLIKWLRNTWKNRIRTSSSTEQLYLSISKGTVKLCRISKLQIR